MNNFLLLLLSLKWQFVCVGVASFLLWYFVFRSYRSLGIRLFYLCTLIAVMSLLWFYNDSQEVAVMEKKGHLLKAKVIQKSNQLAESGITGNVLTLAFELKKDSSQVVSTSEFISDSEFENLRIGNMIDILYEANKNKAYYLVSYKRYKNDKWLFYLLPAFFIVLGIGSGLVFRKYQVGIHEETGDEYLEKDGKIVYDEANNKLAKTAKRINITNKLFRIFK
jgi:hypothetical protein